MASKYGMIGCAGACGYVGAQPPKFNSGIRQNITNILSWNSVCLVDHCVLSGTDVEAYGLQSTYSSKGVKLINALILMSPASMGYSAYSPGSNTPSPLDQYKMNAIIQTWGTPDQLYNSVVNKFPQLGGFSKTADGIVDFLAIQKVYNYLQKNTSW